MESQPLWEYPNHAVSSPLTLATFEMDMFLKDVLATDSGVEKQTSAEFKLPTKKDEQHLEGKLFNGMGFWMDWVYDAETTISTGMQRDSKLGEPVEWNRNFKQGVFIHNLKSQRSTLVRTVVTFNPLNGDVSFGVDV